MKKTITLLTAIFVLAPQFCMAKTVQFIKDNELVHVMVNSQLVAELNSKKSKGYAVRVIKVQEFGECDGSPKTCPKSSIYIAISQYDEYPEQKVYKLPKRHNWEFTAWEHIPTHDGPKEYLLIKLRYQQPTENKSNWWVDKTVIVKANLIEAEIQEGEAF